MVIRSPGVVDLFSLESVCKLAWYYGEIEVLLWYQLEHKQCDDAVIILDR
mgnify:CR=1 FL=1